MLDSFQDLMKNSSKNEGSTTKTHNTSLTVELERIGHIFSALIINRIF